VVCHYQRCPGGSRARCSRTCKMELVGHLFPSLLFPPPFLILQSTSFPPPLRSHYSDQQRRREGSFDKPLFPNHFPPLVFLMLSPLPWIVRGPNLVVFLHRSLRLGSSFSPPCFSGPPPPHLPSSRRERPLFPPRISAAIESPRSF